MCIRDSLTFYQGGLIAANSGVPLPVAMSSAQAEYMAACAASMQAAVVRSLLYNIQFLGTPEYKLYECQVKFPPAILCMDNAATIAMTTSTKLNKKTCHIACHFHFVCDGVERSLHKLFWITKTMQLADALTKTQARHKIDPLIQVFMYSLPLFWSPTPHVVTQTPESQLLSKLCSLRVQLPPVSRRGIGI